MNSVQKDGVQQDRHDVHNPIENTQIFSPPKAEKAHHKHSEIRKCTRHMHARARALCMCVRAVHSPTYQHAYHTEFNQLLD
jgi:hypothetical protein